MLLELSVDASPLSFSQVKSFPVADSRRFLDVTLIKHDKISLKCPATCSQANARCPNEFKPGPFAECLDDFAATHTSSVHNVHVDVL